MILTPHTEQASLEDGFLVLVDKPLNWTSFDVVNKLRYRLKAFWGKKAKVGHAGTLDPLAAGLLLLAAGKFTKKLHDLQAESKSYTGTITLGATTASYDAETEPENVQTDFSFTESQLLEAMKTFEGQIEQYPPIYSAVKVGGKRAYKEARKGREVLVEPRQVRVDQFKFCAYQAPHLKFHLDCGKGTYVRSLAHDLGQLLGTGAYLSELRRTRIGEFSIDDAWQLDDLIAYFEQAQHEGL